MPTKEVEIVEAADDVDQADENQRERPRKDFLFDDLISGRVDTFVKKSVKMLAGSSNNSLLTTSIRQLGDVDFVLIANKPNAKSCLHRIGVRLALRNNAEGATGEDIYNMRADTLRQAYLKKLNAEYGIAFRRFESDDRYFYAINLSFAHLGLMTQLLAYHWRLTTTTTTTTTSESVDPAVYKTFYFIKKHHSLTQSTNSVVDYRYKDYFNCENRTSYPSQLRHDLAYNFLVGARIKLELPPGGGLNPWPDVFSCGCKPSGSSKSCEVNVHDIIAHGIFDDYLCLHPLSEDAAKKKDEIDIEAYPECYRRVTCKCCSRNSIWRSFWYSNLIDCVDLEQRPNEDDRQYLSRVSTIRNSLTPWRFFRGDDDGDGTLDTEKQWADADSASSSLYRMYHLIPLETLRRYFGEKIGFYFCWIELMILSLIAPATIGVTLFLAGLVYYILQVRTALDPETADDFDWKDETLIGDVVVGDVIVNKAYLRQTPAFAVAKACDNYATIAFAAVMIVWAATFGELWKRRSCWYKFLWRVDRLEDSELRRVNVYSLRCIEFLHNFSKWTHLIMYLPSILVTLFFICLVWTSIYVIKMLDIRISREYCGFAASPSSENSTTFLLTPGQEFATALARQARSFFVCELLCVILNSMSIAMLDTIFSKVAYPLTDFEGHSTQSNYNASLILKMFTFRFVNNYSVLFYIAFVVAPDFVLFPKAMSALTGMDETDALLVSQARRKICKQLPCMTMLSKQLIAILLMAPMIRSVKNRFLPVIRNILFSCSCCKKKNPTTNTNGENDAGAFNLSALSRGGTTTSSHDGLNKKKEQLQKLVDEMKSQYENLEELSTLNRREFTIEEFIEKAILFGALLMFSVSQPLAPALAMLFMRIDLNFDIARMVDSFRRPVPVKSSGIGVWANIIEFLTFCGIVTNPIILVLTSSWGTQLSIWWKFWILIIFEHVVFAIRALVAACIPDEPRQLRNLRLRQKMAKMTLGA